MVASRLERFIGIVCAVALAGIHLYLAPGRYAATPWVGSLFIFGALGLLSIAIVIGVENWPRLIGLQRFSWGGGATTAACMLGFFIASRTAGLPGYPRSAWYENAAWPPLAIVSVALEVVFLAVFALSIVRGETSHPLLGSGTRSGHEPADDAAPDDAAADRAPASDGRPA
jgi:hypothetical protein